MDAKNSCQGKCIKGIVCDVTNCVYHDKENRCMAEQILVGPTYASSSSETACVTFKQKTDN
ncbi:MAG: DUF1540 domain-containing protein [Clostridia bacterium]|nr:DUF1540 domain-containing protein [Clostridia bacterium]MBQ1258657.1 DUF1540 domain-containing protein [Clostridia bacterium]